MSYEDFTTFTEVDVAGDRIQKTANHIDHVAQRNETTYLYKDYGAAHFSDFTHEIKTKLAADQASGVGVFWALSNNLGDVNTLTNDGYTLCYLDWYYAPPGYRFIQLNEGHASTRYFDQNRNGFSLDQWAYIKIVKSGTSLIVYLYSNSDYSTLVDTLSLTLHADHSFKYLFGCNTFNTGTAPSLTQDVENFDLEAAAKTRSYGYIF